MKELLLLFTVILLSGANAQNITNNAMKTIFKYSDPAAVDKLTTALNKDTTTAAQIKRVTSWIDKNLVKMGAKVPKGAIEGNKTAMVKYVTGFLNSRASLTKLVNKLFDAVKTVVPTAKATEMKKLLWKIDKETNNDLPKTESEFDKRVVPIIPKDKQSAVFSKLVSTKKDFLTKNPQDAKNLQWTFKGSTSSG
ncbi:hypothetical protein ANCCAN_10851 [Ancylostoma caninum]|uniref:SXP/RAL-2 family protein Ani s 5-like cation-binding domain-containing protein n=1 Tax=Ancylostoma caninum TaxID=29170 RepID=A0A368GFJ1_ANCCA|nr:hypothetical protein ANCCAN_10851 [Ancylostoma caninum]